MKRPRVDRKSQIEKILCTKLTSQEYVELKTKFFVFWQSPYKILTKIKIEYTYGSHKESYTLQDIMNWLNEYRA